jgi:DNA-binding Xre family transcriptional regulator
MENMMQANEAETISQSLEELRQILDNLIEFSFAQEALISSTKEINVRDPKYVEIVNRQKKLIDDFEIINDSLMSLAKKTPQLNTPVTKEISKIHSNLSGSLNQLEERMISFAQTKQQLVMTSANNLALLLGEILDALQQQKANGMPGSQQCKKPGGSTPSMGQMRSMQESLKQQLEEMLKEMKDSKNKSGQGKAGMNMKLSKMMAQQEIFNKMMNDLIQKAGISPETVQKLNEINRMAEETKRDIINRNVTQNTMKRQNDILTRLLEAENAERQREVEEKRESKEAKDLKLSSPENLFKYIKTNESFKEEIELSNIKLYNFYKNKYKTYLLKLNQY